MIALLHSGGGTFASKLFAALRLFFAAYSLSFLEDCEHTVLLTRMTFSMSFDGHQWNIPVESYLLTFMSMFSICSFPGIRRGSCRLWKRSSSVTIEHFVKWNMLRIIYWALLLWLHSLWAICFPRPFLSSALRHLKTQGPWCLSPCRRRSPWFECYWLNGITTHGQLPAFTLSSSSWCHAAQIVKAPTGSHFKYFRNLPSHILLSQLMVINVSAKCHKQTG